MGHVGALWCFLIFERCSGLLQRPVKMLRQKSFWCLGRFKWSIVFLVLLWIPMFLWEIPVVFLGDGAMLLFNLWEAQLGGNPITDHLWKLPRKEAKVTLNSNGEISFEVSGGGFNKKNPLPWKSQNCLQVKCPSKVMDGNGRSHDVPFLFEKVFWPIFRGEFAVSLFGGLGWQKLLLKRARKRGIDLGLIPFFGMGFKKA